MDQIESPLSFHQKKCADALARVKAAQAAYGEKPTKAEQRELRLSTVEYGIARLELSDIQQFLNDAQVRRAS